ncbi:hypothetical protein S83_012484 [Arachis hypogaea]
MATTLLYTIGNNGTIATALAGRHADGSLHVEDFIIEVKDQSGKKVQLGFENDQRAVMMGLMLDANEKLLIRQETTNMHLKFLLCERLHFLSVIQKSLSLLITYPFCK